MVHQHTVFGSGGGFGGFSATPVVQPSDASLRVAPIQGYNPTNTWVLIGIGGAIGGYALTKAFGGTHTTRNAVIGAVAAPAAILGAAYFMLRGL